MAGLGQADDGLLQGAGHRGNTGRGNHCGSLGDAAHDHIGEGGGAGSGRLLELALLDEGRRVGGHCPESREAPLSEESP